MNKYLKSERDIDFSLDFVQAKRYSTRQILMHLFPRGIINYLESILKSERRGVILLKNP
jgi:hypothetical protein